MKTLIAALTIVLSIASVSIAADFGPATQPQCESQACPIGSNGQPEN